jgi:hypothetical protein
MAARPETDPLSSVEGIEILGPRITSKGAAGCLSTGSLKTEKLCSSRKRSAQSPMVS